MRSALITVIGFLTLLLIAPISAPAASRDVPRGSWMSPAARSGGALIYLAGPDGVYLYRERDVLMPVGFLYLGNVTTLGLAVDAARNIYVSYENGSAYEYAPTAHGFALVKQFATALYDYDLAVGPDGTVYVDDTNTLGLFEYVPGNATPIDVPAIAGGVVSGIAVDAKNDLFVAYQFPVENSRIGGFDHCNRGSYGQIEEYAPHATSGRCIKASFATENATGMTFDAAGNLLVSNAYVDTHNRQHNEIGVFAPPDWRQVALLSTGIGRAGGSDLLAFGAANHLYYLGPAGLVDRDYPTGGVRKNYTIPQPYAFGIAASAR